MCWFLCYVATEPQKLQLIGAFGLSCVRSSRKGCKVNWRLARAKRAPQAGAMTHPLCKPEKRKNTSQMLVEAMLCQVVKESRGCSPRTGSYGIALPGRLELPTLRLTASRSNQLSYESR